MSITTTTDAPPEGLVKSSSLLAVALGIEPKMMIETLKAQCFKGLRPEQVTNAQLASFISIAAALKLNPLLPGMMYAYPERNGGITPMVGPDGVFYLLANNHDIVAGASGSAWWVEHSKEGEEIVCTAFINHKTKGLVKKTVYLSEWRVETNPNWKTRQRHMLEIRALKQCARQIMHGIPMDEDERKLSEMTRVQEESPIAAPAETLGTRLAGKRGRPRAGTVVEGHIEPPSGGDASLGPTGASGPEDAAGTVGEAAKTENASQPAAAAAPAPAKAPEPAPAPAAAPSGDAAALVERQGVIDGIQDEMLEMGVSETRLLQYARKIQGFVPEDVKSVWDLPTASIAKLKLAIKALSVGREPKI